MEKKKIELERCSFKQTCELKEFGYPLEVLSTEFADEYIGKAMVVDTEKFSPYPYLDEVAKWLRDNKNVSVMPFFTYCGYADRMRDLDKRRFKTTGIVYKRYEDALSVGIDEAINYLKSKK